MGRPILHRKGTRFSKLKVVALHPMDKHNNLVFLCECDCGSRILVLGANLRSGHSKSCGCPPQKRYGDMRKENVKLYDVWKSMLGRCNDRTNKAYVYYGGRGIKVCKRWYDFVAFSQDMQDSYIKHRKKNKQTTLERINNDGDYKPSNCRWATMKEQNLNKRPRILTSLRRKDNEM